MLEAGIDAAVRLLAIPHGNDPVVVVVLAIVAGVLGGRRCDAGDRDRALLGDRFVVRTRPPVSRMAAFGRQDPALAAFAAVRPQRSVLAHDGRVTAKGVSELRLVNVYETLLVGGHGSDSIGILATVVPGI